MDNMNIVSFQGKWEKIWLIDEGKNATLSWNFCVSVMNGTFPYN